MTNARVRLQVDVGFGEAVTPEAWVVEIPPLLDFPAAVRVPQICNLPSTKKLQDAPVGVEFPGRSFDQFWW